ncbi:hypothetical protein AX16_006991 [Volvariella volvacea WC 439]|nr:hypothetical protein AX16_006991 [Volvariella volvacea WC 439]
MTLARISSRTPLQAPSVLPIHTSSSQAPLASSYLASILLPVAHFFSAKRLRTRTTLLAILAFILLLAYLVCLQHPSFPASVLSLRPPFNSLSGSQSRTGTPADQLAVALETIRNATTTKTSLTTSIDAQRGRTQITLNPEEELAAVSSFIASLPQNVIPPYVNPDEPVDPQLILDFDTRGPRAKEEVRVLVDDVWTRNPVFLYAKYYSPASREVKRILDSFRLLPEPTIVDIDLREDVDVLKPLIARLCSTEELPVLLVGGQNVGSLEQIRALNESGELKKLIVASGATVDNKKKKKKH